MEKPPNKFDSRCPAHPGSSVKRKKKTLPIPPFPHRGLPWALSGRFGLKGSPCKYVSLREGLPGCPQPTIKHLPKEQHTLCEIKSEGLHEGMLEHDNKGKDGEIFPKQPFLSIVLGNTPAESTNGKGVRKKGAGERYERHSESKHQQSDKKHTDGRTARRVASLWPNQTRLCVPLKAHPPNWA